MKVEISKKEGKQKDVEISLSDFEILLKKHDWSYNYSDDQAVWRAGRDSYLVLVNHAKYNPKLQDLFDVYKAKYA